MSEVMKGEARVEEDPNRPGEFLIVFPEGFLEAAGFKEGDKIVWEPFGNTFLMRKQ